MRYVSCAAPNCPSRRVSERPEDAAELSKAERHRLYPSFHKFPVGNPALLARWLRNMGRSNSELSKWHLLCSHHFTEDCLIHMDRFTQLRSGAVPTIFPQHYPLNPTMPRKDLVLSCIQEDLSDCQKKYIKETNAAYYKAIRRANELVGKLMAAGDWTPPAEALARLQAEMLSRLETAVKPAAAPPVGSPGGDDGDVEVLVDDGGDDDSRDMEPAMTRTVTPPSPAPAPQPAALGAGLTLAPLPRATRPLVDDNMFADSMTSEIPPPQKIPLRSTAAVVTSCASSAPAAVAPPLVTIASVGSLGSLTMAGSGTGADTATGTAQPGASVASTGQSLVAPLNAAAAATTSTRPSSPEVVPISTEATAVSASSSAAGAAVVSVVAATNSPAASGSTSSVTAASAPVSSVASKPQQQEDMQPRAFPALHVAVRTPHSLTQSSKTQYPTRRAILDQRVKKVLLHTASQFTEWLIQTRLVRASQLCPSHPVTWSGQPRQLRLGMFTDSDKLAYSGGYVWVKTCCRPKFLSVYHGSVFDSVKLLDPNTQPVSILKLMYHWACQTPLANVAHWLKLRPPIIDEVYGLLRAVCMLKVEENLPKLGSIGGRVQVGLVSLGTAGVDGLNKNVKVEVLGVKDEVSGEIRMVGFEPRIKNRIRSVVGAVQEWVTPECSLLLDHSISALPFRPHFKRVENASASNKEVPGNIMHYLRRSMPRMFQTSLVHLPPPTICQFIAEITWREKFGRDPNATFSNLIAHLGAITQMNKGCLIDMLKKVLQSPSMDLKRRPRKQTLAARPDCEPQFSSSVTACQLAAAGKSPASASVSTIAPKPATKPPTSQPTGQVAAQSESGGGGSQQTVHAQKHAAHGQKRVRDTTTTTTTTTTSATTTTNTTTSASKKPRLSKDCAAAEAADIPEQGLSDDGESEASAAASVGTEGSLGGGTSGSARDRSLDRELGRAKQTRKRQVGGRSRKKGGKQPKQTITDAQRGSFFKLADLQSLVVPSLAGMRCWECKLPLTHPRHLTGVYACKRCRYTTCCEKIYPVHRRVFHSPGVLPVFATGTPTILAEPLYCVCGYGTTSGNRLALHMVGCECRTARPTRASAASSPHVTAVKSERLLEPPPAASPTKPLDGSVDMDIVKQDVSRETSEPSTDADQPPVLSPAVRHSSATDVADAIDMEEL